MQRSVIVILFLLHPLFDLKDKIDWTVYLFVAGLLLVLLLSPSIEQIKAKDIEIKMHASAPLDPFPSPARMEGDIGDMSKGKRSNRGKTH
jgi:hypothetical protein